jgi:hypothetical protein
MARPWEYNMTDLKATASVADILERELGPTIKDWLRRVNLVPELIDVPLSDADRTGHLPKLYFDLIFRLRLAKNVLPPPHIRRRFRARTNAAFAGLLCWHAH